VEHVSRLGVPRLGISNCEFRLFEEWALVWQRWCSGSYEESVSSGETAGQNT
jgi:hypothetical protein